MGVLIANGIARLTTVLCDLVVGLIPYQGGLENAISDGLETHIGWIRNYHIRVDYKMVNSTLS